MGDVPPGYEVAVTPERWERVKELFSAAEGRDPGDREAFVAQACGGDSDVRREVLELLAAATAAADTDFIEEPMVRLFTEPERGLEVGHRLGPYRVEREIGRGGMGAVYLAVRDDKNFDMEVAIKVLRRGIGGDDNEQRFRRERQILADLVHPNIARLLDGGTAPDGISYLVMEDVDGVRIDRYCDNHGLDQRARLRMFATVCRAVHFAHRSLIVHCDLKPANILVEADGTPKLLDFGIAKLLQAPESAASPGVRLFTPDYASPEQLSGGAITTSTDVYSLGVLLHVLLVGRLPVRHVQAASGGGAADTAGQAPAARGGGPGCELRGDLAKIVEMSLRDKAAERYASAQAFADDIDRFLRVLPVVAHKDSWRYRTWRFVQRNPKGAGVAALVALLIVSFGITVSVLLHRSILQQQRAERVSSFLQDLFAIPDPGKSRGETIPAREILDRGAEQIQQELREEPETRAALLETMSKVYSNLGLYGPALALSRNAVRLRRATLGNDHPDLAESLHTLANVLRRTDDLAAAEPIVQEAVAIQRRNAHGDDAELARGLNNQATLYDEKGDPERAEPLYRESLAMKQRLFHGDNAELATGLHNLAHLLQLKNDLAGAETLYLEALAMRRRLAGPRPDPDVATTLNNLAALREDQHDIAAAESLYREACSLRERLYSSGPEVPRCLNNLARMVEARGAAAEAKARGAAAEAEARGAAAEAESLYRRALDIYQRNNLEPRSMDRAIFLRNLADLLCRRRPADGEPLARESLGIFQGIPSSSWRAADAASVLGGCLAGLQRAAEAGPLLETSVQRLCEKPGGGSSYTRKALARLDAFYASRPAPVHAAAACAPLRLPSRRSLTAIP